MRVEIEAAGKTATFAGHDQLHVLGCISSFKVPAPMVKVGDVVEAMGKVRAVRVLEEVRG